MDNKTYYTAIKNTVDYYRKNKSEDGFYIFKENFDKFGLKDLEQYYEDIDYRKIFWRSYYRRFLDTSPSLDFEGKEINWEERMVATVMYIMLQNLLEDRTAPSKYYLGNDINDTEYEELLKEHDLV